MYVDSYRYSCTAVGISICNLHIGCCNIQHATRFSPEALMGSWMKIHHQCQCAGSIGFHATMHATTLPLSLHRPSLPRWPFPSPIHGQPITLLPPPSRRSSPHPRCPLRSPGRRNAAGSLVTTLPLQRLRWPSAHSARPLLARPPLARSAARPPNAPCAGRAPSAASLRRRPPSPTTHRPARPRPPCHRSQSRRRPPSPTPAAAPRQCRRSADACRRACTRGRIGGLAARRRAAAAPRSRSSTGACS